MEGVIYGILRRMWHREHIIRLIASAAEGSGRRPSTVARICSGSGDLYARLCRGHDITTRRAARVVQALSDLWPEGAEWPADIPRPPPRAPREAA